MPWGKLDDSLYDHPKLDRLGRNRLLGVGLWSVAISWCNRRLTDGHVPIERIKRLGGTVRLADALVEAELFERTPDGYLVHDFLHFNESKATVLARRAAEAERQRKRRESQAESGRDTGRTTGVSTRTPSRPVPASPVPAAQPAPDDGLSSDETAVFAFLAQHGAAIREDSGYGRRLLGLMERRTPERVLETAWDMAQGDAKLSDRQWTFGLEARLEPPEDGREAAKAERSAEQARQSERGFEATQRYLRELRG